MPSRSMMTTYDALGAGADLLPEPGEDVDRGHRPGRPARPRAPGPGSPRCRWPARWRGSSASWVVSRAKSAKPTAIVMTTMPRTATRIREAKVLPSRGMPLLRTRPGCASVDTAGMRPRWRRPPAWLSRSHKTISIAAMGRNAHNSSGAARPRSYGDATQRGESGNRSMAAIELRNVTKKFATADGGTYTALKDLSLTVEDGQFCAVVGPDGLRQVHHADPGLRTRAAHRAARPWSTASRSGASTRGVGFVFQQDAVFPWRSVLDNVAAGPLFRGGQPPEATALARGLAAPGRPGRLRGPLPAPAVRRHAQARGAGAVA